MLTLGLVINPLAGVGGPAAMKGSDGPDAQTRARDLGITPQAGERAREVFRLLHESADARSGLRVICPRGLMGSDALVGTGFAPELLDLPARVGSATDTRVATRALLPRVDLLVFVGGDGTARDILDAVSESSGDGVAENAGRAIPVLGIPAGVKMHSGVFATSPRSAAALLQALIKGGLVGAVTAEVKDIDEAALRRGEVSSRTYGELLVPAEGGYLQHVKSGGKEVEALVLLEIAAEIKDSQLLSESPLLIGPGSTCLAVKQDLLESGEAATLLGFDVLYRGKALLLDANVEQLLAVHTEHPELNVLLSYSRRQGFLLGRGNQQLGGELLTQLDPAQLHIVSSRTKLESLEGRPLLVDTGSQHLDEKFSGLRQITSGYQDKLLYLVQPA